MAIDNNSDNNNSNIVNNNIVNNPNSTCSWIGRNLFHRRELLLIDFRICLIITGKAY